MKKNIAVLGGDLRISTLAKILAEDGNQVRVFGMEKSNEIEENDKIIKSKNINEAIEASDIIIGSIPFLKSEGEMYAIFSEKHIKIKDLVKNKYKDKVFIAGNIPENAEKILKDSYGNVIDIMKREELAILNTIATAEGAIDVAIQNTDTILHGRKVLVLGFGRVGKVVARKFYELSAKVTCAARKFSDFAWIWTFGYDVANIYSLQEDLKDYDIIINTVPKMIIDKRQMKYMKSNVLLIDLASAPGGINKEDAKDLNLKLICALALPGKVAPITSAYFIKQSIYNIFEEME